MAARKAIIDRPASIVPPPFGSGYAQSHCAAVIASWLQLCRPLSGAVICDTPGKSHSTDIGFNCAAPFRERLWSNFRNRHRRSLRFNCAAPFRERLCISPRVGCCAPLWLQLCRPLSGAVIAFSSVRGYGVVKASIVPPPFGSGYPMAIAAGLALLMLLQLCRPLSGAVITCTRAI